MTVTQRPRPREFCATMQDYIIDTDATITFAVYYGGKKILDEEYVPDAQNRVRIRRLGRFCELALWGEWCDGEMYLQTSASGTFSFYINNVKDADSLVIYSFLQTRKSADSPGVLSGVDRKVTRPGVPEYVSGFPYAGGCIVNGILTDGTEKSQTLALGGGQDQICTIDAGYGRICSLLGVESLQSYRLSLNGGSMEFLADTTPYAERWVFRFKNVYDMPETLCCTGGLSVAGSSEDDTASMYGVERKFGLKVTDEYTARSGIIHLRSEYKLWHNLLNAREVEVWNGSEWLPIIITKQKLERDFRRSVLSTVEFSFRMADPTQNNLIE
ncbi:hypothetical protein [Bacteroides sp. An19]|uniref:hypothetical protein n=1 Tax=Bacteroides sp. An19 TaxID=1965580 RepID=UPI000B3668C8|nr:hypothetical protein [Bacteroides sp. An19]OUP37402.1 hypothetical protein B5F25_01050 [Bacteroides sp. An19]